MLLIPFLKESEMNYVDQILKYLSGELPEDEREQFEKELLNNASLKLEYDQVKLIEDTMKQMKRVPGESSSDREEFIREIVVEHDRNVYGGPPESREEFELISNIKKKSAASKKPVKRNRGSVIRMTTIFISVAASITLLLVVIMQNPSSEALYSQFYQPGDDPTLTHLRESTRSNAQTGIALFFAGRYQQTLDYFRPFLNEEEIDPYIRLFYALACMELQCEEDLMPVLDDHLLVTGGEIENSIIWYKSLYLLKKGASEKAKDQLINLTASKNPYTRNANRLLRKID